MGHQPDTQQQRLHATRSLPTWRASISLTVLATLALLGNYFSLPLFYGVDFIFGSVAVLITIYYFGMFWGIIVCAVSTVYTTFLWGHPYAMILFQLESVFIGYCFYKRKQRNLIFLDILFWLFIGGPLSFILYHYVLALPTSTAILIMCKQAVNGICNATLAVGILLLFSGSRIGKIAGSNRISFTTWKIEDLTTFLFAAIILLPMLTAVKLQNRNQTAELPSYVGEDADREARRAVLATNIFINGQINNLKEYLNLYETDLKFKPGHNRFESVVAVFKDHSQPPVQLASVSGTDILKDQHLEELVLGKDVCIRWAECLQGLKTNRCLSIYLTGSKNINLFAIVSSEATDEFQSNFSNEGWEFMLISEDKFHHSGFDPLHRDDFIQKKEEIHFLAALKNKKLPDVKQLQQSEWHEFRYIPNTDNLYIHIKISIKHYLPRLEKQFIQFLIYGLGSVIFALLLIPFMTRILARPLLMLSEFTRQYENKEGIAVKTSMPQSSITEIKELSDEFSRMIQKIELEKEINVGLLKSAETSEKQINDILEISDDGIITADENGIILSYNEGAEKIFGYSKNEVVGQTIHMFLPLRFRESHPANIRSFINGEIDSRQMGKNRQVSALTKNRGEITAEVTVAKLVNSMGILLIAIVRDISERIAKTDRIERQASLMTTVAMDTKLFSQDPLETIKFVLTRAAEILGVPRIGLRMFNSTFSQLQSIFQLDLNKYGTSEIGVFMMEDHPLYFENISQGRVLLLDDALSDPILRSFKRDYLIPHKIVSLMELPVLEGGNLIGVISIAQTGKNRTWLSDEVSFGGALASIIALVLEIDEHKTTELKLEQVRDDLIRFVDTANAPIFGIDAKGRVNEWNQTAERITGFRKDEVVGRNMVEDFITDEYKNAVKEVLGNALAGDETINVEFPLYTKDGLTVVVLFNSTTRRDVNGEIVGVVGVGQDITELLQYQQNLEELIEDRTTELNTSLADTQQARDRIDGILKSVADGLIVTDTQNRIILMNRAAEIMLDTRFEDVFERPIEYAIREQSLQDKVREVYKKLTNGCQFDFELLSNRDDEIIRSKIMRASAAVILDKGGIQTGIVTLIHDVTHEREVDRMKTEFISTAAHELRTPLTSIMGFSEILITRKNLPPEAQDKYLGFINKQAIHLAKIINDLLDISRLESGTTMKLVKEKFVVQDILVKILPHLHGLTDKHDFNSDFPEEKIQIHGDKEKISQVLINLLGNAIKYSPNGGEIQVQARVENDYFVCAVMDKGIGMTSEQAAHVFDRFYRADASNSAPEGTGLGMTIVKNIIDAHEGEIWIESKPNEGTRVIFKLLMA